MNKLRILIAESDINYIIPLQNKFIKEYFNSIELEIITEKDYFYSKFSIPQQIDIAIISEEFFNQTILIHNIGKIIILTETNISNKYAGQNITTIYKYTNIKEIFNSINGVFSSNIINQKTKTKDAKIITITSAIGGCGKTLLSMAICSYLNNNYKRVLFIGAERLQTFQSRLTDKSPIISNAFYAMLLQSDVDKTSIYNAIKKNLRNEGFSYIPPFKAGLMSLEMEYSIFIDIALQAKQSKDFDFIIIDTDHIFDINKVQLIDAADKVVIVTKQDANSVFATNVFATNIDGGANNDKFIYVCNNYDSSRDNAIANSQKSNKFTVNDYIKSFSTDEQMEISNIINSKDIQKLAFSLI